MPPTMRSAEEEAHAPKYAQFERERRWLVDPAKRSDLSHLPWVLIEDRYITSTRMRLRRMTDSATGAQSLKLTRKYEAADPLARPIVTAYLTPAEYDVFAALAAASLEKRRYMLDGFSLDVFAGPLSGLELAEIEWPDDSGLRGLAAPLWAGQEVSADARYQGGSLSQNGLPKD